MAKKGRIMKLEAEIQALKEEKKASTAIQKVYRGQLTGDTEADRIIADLYRVALTDNDLWRLRNFASNILANRDEHNRRKMKDVPTFAYTNEQVQLIRMESHLHGREFERQALKEVLISEYNPLQQAISKMHGLSIAVAGQIGLIRDNRILKATLPLFTKQAKDILDDLSGALIRAERWIQANEEHAAMLHSLHDSFAQLHSELYRFQVGVHQNDEIRQEKAIQDMQAHLNVLTSDYVDVLNDVINSVDLGGRKRGMVTWRFELAQEWLEIEQAHPDWSQEDVHAQLLDKYTLRDLLGMKGRTIKLDLSDTDQKKAESLIKKSAIKDPSNYGGELKRAYRQQESSIELIE